MLKVIGRLIGCVLGLTPHRLPKQQPARDGSTVPDAATHPGRLVACDPLRRHRLLAEESPLMLFSRLIQHGTAPNRIVPRVLYRTILNNSPHVSM